MTQALKSYSGQAGITDLRSSWQPTKQIRQILQDHNESVPAVGLERALHYTDFFSRFGNNIESAHMRCARALAFHLERKTININFGELLVGSHTEHRIGAICHIEKAGLAMLEDLDTYTTRAVNPLWVDPDLKEQIQQRVIPYWADNFLAARTLLDGKGDVTLSALGRNNEFLVSEAAGIAHFLPDFEGLIQTGTSGLRTEIERKLQDTAADARQEVDYLTAALTVLDAVEAFADRHLAEAIKQNRTDLVEVLTTVPRLPAGNLHEAFQTVWFYQLLLQVESLDQGISLGRIDQYLYPLFAEERQRGTLDTGFIRELIACLAIKLSEVVPLFSDAATPYLSGLPSGQALTLGGLDQRGVDASNDLTDLFLDVLGSVKTRQPNWHARMHENSEPGYVDKIIQLILQGGGSPALYNDDVIMPAMLRRGVDQSRVWNYATVGCVEPAVQGISFTSSDAALVNLVVNLERVLGLDMSQPEVVERSETDSTTIQSMAQLLQLLQEQMNAQMDELKATLDPIEIANRDHFPTPLASLTVQGCLESATDLTAGGAVYNASGIQGVGLADLANSLAAIDKMVFREQQYTLDEITEACTCNYAGFETMRVKLLANGKYGNDDPDTDIWMNRVIEMFDQAVSRHVNTRGGAWMPGFYSMTCHRGFGMLTSALPSGRLEGESLADGLAPSDGSDLLGPTACLNSVSSLDSKRFGNGVNLNLKLDTGMLSNGLDVNRVRALIMGYFEQGGMQVQINVLDSDELKDAIAHPDRHRDLLVRVSGYSAFFVDLTPEMQQEIVDRTDQRLSIG